MTEATINTKTVPTAEAIREALEALRNLAEEKSSGETSEDCGKLEQLFHSDVLRTIEAALNSCADAKRDASPSEDAPDGETEDAAFEKTYETNFTRSHSDDDDSDDDDSDDDEEDETENNSWDFGDILAIGAGVAIGAAVVYGGIKLGKAIFRD